MAEDLEVGELLPGFQLLLVVHGVVEVRDAVAANQVDCGAGDGVVDGEVGVGVVGGS